MIIEIEGTEYQLIEQPKRTRGGLTGLATMAAMFAGLQSSVGIGGGYSRPAPQVDMVEEFKLIQQKKSKLSKRDRDWVVYQFNRNFRKINPNQAPA